MTLPVTAAAASLCVALAGLFGWLGARPAKVGAPRVIPWRLLMLLAFTGFIAFAVHLVTLVRGG